MIKCSQCERENENIFKYCLSCGAELKPKTKMELPAQPAKKIEPEQKKEVPEKVVLEDVSQEQEIKESPVPLSQRATQKTSLPACKLQLIKPDGGIGKEYPFNIGENSIGTDGATIISADDAHLSRIHAVFTVSDSNVKFKDMGGTNGSYIRIKGEVPMNNSDFFRLGQGLFRFEFLHTQQKNKSELDTEKGGSPIPEGVYGRLLRLQDKHTLVSAHFLRGKETKIGRTRGEVVFSEDPFLSGSHVMIIKRGNEIFLKDLGSSNGTYIRIIKEMTLEDGDSILMGQNLYRFRL